MVIARLQLGGVRRAVSKLAAESAAPAPCRQLEVKPVRARRSALNPGTRRPPYRYVSRPVTPRCPPQFPAPHQRLQTECPQRRPGKRIPHSWHEIPSSAPPLPPFNNSTPSRRSVNRLASGSRRSSRNSEAHLHTGSFGPESAMC